MSGERPVSGSAKSGKPAARGNYDKPWHIFHISKQGRLHNDSGGASRFFYCAKASRSEREAGLEEFDAKMVYRMGHGNNEPDPKTQSFISHTCNPHPTVKPLALTEYLARLIRPPEEYLDDAILLIPFCGTGSEVCGAIRAGWKNWLGIEIDEEYAEIARARIAYWQKQVEADRQKRSQLEMVLNGNNGG